MPWQTEQTRLDLDGDAHLHALEGVLEGDADARLEVVAACRLPAPPRRAAAEHAAEEIAEVPEVELLEARTARTAGRRRRGSLAPPAAPNVSYAFRFSGSESRSYAACTSLNLSSAPLSPGLRSGWYSRASLRYAFLISSSDAFFATPSTS